MSRKLVVAAAQLGPVNLGDDRASVVARLVAMLQESAARGARFVAFPELAFTTFFPRWWFDNEDEVNDRFFERSMPSPVTQPLFDEAQRLGVGFYIGYGELAAGESGSPNHRFNTAILVGPDGSIVGKYRKVHLPGHADHKPEAAFQHLEKKYFEVGDLGFPTYRYGAGGVDLIAGMLICNDRRWPEGFRVLGLQGAEMVVLGFNTPTENLHYPEPPALRVHHHLIMAQSMAYQNSIWLIETAKAGVEDGFRMFGHSVIVAPTGEIVAQTVSEDDEVIVATADLDLSDDLRRTMFNLAAHRRPEHYGLLVERVGVEVTPAN
ncbi:MAG: N-carbamoyl-D-amino-acid hydrolase [Actinomycetia bacterium]|nr:N-carbamoyl-D-amino-acid hydrolase [Actinomycetes bacterium]